MSVKKVFVILGTIVVCIVVIAFALNVLMPNVVKQVSNAVENSIYKATGFAFDINGDGTKGSNSADVSGNVTQGSATDAANSGAGVDGFSKAQ